MRIGYARVSTEDQRLDLQRDALKQAKCRQVYEEQATGKNIARLQLEACLKSLREGDTLVVWRLDRLGRNLADLVGLVADMEIRKINFESLTEKIETVSPAGRLVFHVFAALAEFERNLIRERTMAGLICSSRPRPYRWPPSKAHTERDKDDPSPAQIGRDPCCRDRRPLPYRPLNPLSSHPQAPGLSQRCVLEAAPLLSIHLGSQG